MQILTINGVIGRRAEFAFSRRRNKKGRTLRRAAIAAGAVGGLGVLGAGAYALSRKGVKPKPASVGSPTARTTVNAVQNLRTQQERTKRSTTKLAADEAALGSYIKKTRKRKELRQRLNNLEPKGGYLGNITRNSPMKDRIARKQYLQRISGGKKSTRRR